MSSDPHQASTTYDEICMQRSMLFSDSLKDLKHLRTQLYSAAQYFEVSYTKEEQKEAVFHSLKDYTVKALVNTVDHLGSITYKVTDLMEEKVDEVSGTELRVSCIQQRLRTCQECMDREGFSQQSFVMTIPKFHKRYTLPGQQGKLGSEDIASESNGYRLDSEYSWNHKKNAVRTTIRRSRSRASKVRKGRSTSPSPQRSLRMGHFAFPDKQKVSETRTSSPLRSKFPLLRTGSLASRSATPKPSRPTTSNLSKTKPRCPSEPRKSFSMRVRADGDNQSDVEQHPSKSKRLLKALLSRSKSKKNDTTVYTFLDEY